METTGMRFVDVAIFLSMGGLWVLGATFIVLVWRWVIRYERANPDQLNNPPVPTAPTMAAQVELPDESRGEAVCAVALPLGTHTGLTSEVMG